MQPLNSSTGREFKLNTEFEFDRLFAVSCYFETTGEHRLAVVYARDAFEALCDYLQTKPVSITTVEQLLAWASEHATSIKYLEL
jgi:hypothetical protein